VNIFQCQLCLVEEIELWSRESGEEIFLIVQVIVVVGWVGGEPHAKSLFLLSFSTCHSNFNLSSTLFYSPMTSKQIQFTEHEKQEPSRSEPLPIPTAKESRSYSFSHEKHYIISSSVPNDPKFPPESFVHSKPLDDSSIRSKLHGENGREEEKSRRLRATTSYREMKLLNKFRSDESLVPSATTPPPPRSRHEKKKRAYSTFGDPSDRKLDDSESDNDEQLNTPEDKKIQTTKKSKSPKDQKLKREGSSKKGEYSSLNLFILFCFPRTLSVTHILTTTLISLNVVLFSTLRSKRIEKIERNCKRIL
jgi:hypothetical protein